MSRYLSWLLNCALLAVGCLLLADTANAVLSAWLAPSPDEVTAAPAAAPRIDRSWARRNLIIERNLFNASLVAEPAPEDAPEPENLEATKLPLVLIGTAAATVPEASWAAVQDNSSRQHLVLQIGDTVQGKAKVERIEPKRIVLRENGQLRELALSDDPAPAAGRAAPRASARKQSSNRRAARNARNARTNRNAKRAAEARAEAEAKAAEAAENPLATAAELFAQGQFEPRFTADGTMDGVAISAVEAGSSLDAAGLSGGDVIVEVNGIVIDSQERGQEAIAALSENQTIQMKVRAPDGSIEEIDVSPDP